MTCFLSLFTLLPFFFCEQNTLTRRDARVIVELKRRRRQNNRLNFQNNRSARAFYILMRFFAVLVLTTTWNDRI